MESTHWLSEVSEGKGKMDEGKKEEKEGRGKMEEKKEEKDGERATLRLLEQPARGLGT